MKLRATVIFMSLPLAAPAGFEGAWARFTAFFEELATEQEMVGGAVWFFHEGTPIGKALHGTADVGASYFDTGATVSNSGWSAPIGDVDRYAAFLMGSADPGRQGEHDAILTRSFLEEMWEPVLFMTDPVAGESASKIRVGLVFFLVESGRRKLLGQQHVLTAVRERISSDIFPVFSAP